VGLVGGVDRRVKQAVGAKVINAEQAQPGAVQRAPRRDQAFGPAGLAPLCIGRQMAMCRNATGHQHHRGIGRADQFIAQAGLDQAGMAHRHGDGMAAAQCYRGEGLDVGNGGWHAGLPMKVSHRGCGACVHCR
jgi:hypothetical protein